MPDQNTPTETQQQAAPAEQNNQAQLDLAKLAQFAFQDEIKPDPSSPAAIVNNPPPASATPASPAEPTETVVDANEFVKKYGVESIEAFDARWNQLSELEKNPPKASEPVWVNDDSKKLAAYINSGDTEKVINYLQARRDLAGVDNMAPEQKLKLYIKLQNPLYDTELVDYQFQNDFEFNEAAFKDETGNIKDPLAHRFAKTQALQKRQQALSQADEFFKAYKTKIELPDSQIANQTTPDKEYEDYKASIAQSKDSFEKIVAPALNALTEKDLSWSVELKDDQNQMDMNLPVVLDKADFDAARKEALDLPGFLTQTCYTKEGKFLPNNLVSIVALYRNFGKYAQSIARQAVNAERERVIKKETTPGGTRREYAQSSGADLQRDQQLKEFEKFAFQDLM